MPNGPTHDKITVALAAAGASVALWYGFTGREVFMYAAATLASGLILSPDLDLDSEPYTRWGALRFIWWPYKVVLPHRSWVSHGPFIGAPIRVVYLAAAVLILWTGCAWSYDALWIGKGADIAAIASQSLSMGYSWLAGCEPRYLVAAGIGVEVGAESHIMADFISTAWRTRRRFKRRQRRQGSGS